MNQTSTKQRLLKHYRKALLAISAACTCLLVQTNKCYAYYWGWGSGLSYYNIGSTLLWPINSLFYPYSNYTSPYGLSSLFGYHYFNRAVNNTNISSYPNIPYNNSANATNSGMFSVPNSAYNYGGYTVNNNTVSNYTTPPNSANTQPFNDPNDVFNYRYLAGNNNVPGLANLNSQSSPPVAPDRRSIDQSANETQSNTTFTAGQNASIDGFFQTVIVRYKDNLIQALQKPDMHSWAESIGLVEAGQAMPSNLNKARKNEISAIVKDSTLEPHNKLYILRLLIKK